MAAVPRSPTTLAVTGLGAHRARIRGRITHKTQQAAAGFQSHASPASSVARVGCAGLTIAGGVFEIAGFFLVACELARIQYRELGEPVLVRRARARLRKLSRRSRDQTVKAGSAELRATATLRARGRARQGPGTTLESRVDALEENARRLEDEIDEQNATFGGDIQELSAKLSLVQAELKEERRRGEKERKAALRTSVALQAWGTGLFVFGAILSVLGNTINC